MGNRIWENTNTTAVVAYSCCFPIRGTTDFPSNILETIGERHTHITLLRDCCGGAAQASVVVAAVQRALFRWGPGRTSFAFGVRWS